MDSHVTVNIVDEGSSIPVPNTGGATMGGLSISETGIIGVGVIMLVLALVAAVVAMIKKSKGHRIFDAKKSFRVNAKKRLIFGMTMLFVLSGALSFNVMQLTKQENGASAIGEDIPEGFDNTLAISTADITMDVELGSENTFAFVGNDVVVKSPTLAGYELFMYAKQPNLVNKKTNKTIDSLPVNGEREIEVKTPLDENTWGFSYNKPTKMESVNWNGFEDNLDDATNIKSVYGATEANDKTTLYFGVNLTPDFPAGSYETVITYVAIANFVDPDISFAYILENGYFDEAGTQDLNVVGYSCVGEDEEPNSQCTWMRVAGKHKKPFLGENQMLYYEDGWYSSEFGGVEDNSIINEDEEIISALNRGVYEDYYGQSIVLENEVVDSFTITYHPNGGHFERICNYSDPAKDLRLLDNDCVEGEVESVLRQYMIGFDFRYPYGLNNYDDDKNYRSYHDNEDFGIVGWSEDPNALTPTYPDGGYIQTSSIIRGTHIDLYAVWGHQVE